MAVEAGSEHHETHAHNPQVLLALACVAQFMVVLDVSIVNVALPQIGRDLHYSSVGLQWVVNAYVLTFAGFLLLGGRAADLFGRRRIFLLGLGLFSLASLLGGLAQNSTELTTARAVQGLGGAVLSPATLTIITTTFTDAHERMKAIGIWSSVAGAGGATGAVFGGLLTGYLSWRWVFFVNVPIGAAAIVLATIRLTEARRLSKGKLDIAGALLVTAGLTVLVYGIVGTDTHPWGSTRTIGLLLLSGLLLGGFLYVQHRVASAPLMPLSLFRIRSVTTANITMLLVGACFFTMWYFLTLYLQIVHGYSPLRAGMLFLPMGLSIIVGAQSSVRLIRIFDAPRTLMLGLVVVAAGFAILADLHASSSYVTSVLPASLMASLGIGLAFTPLAQTATSGVPMEMAGLASGVLNTARQVGGSIGLAALATIAAAQTRSVAHDESAKAALTSGFDRAFLVAVAVMVVAFAASLAIPRQPRSGTEPSMTADPLTPGDPTPAPAGD